MIKRIKKVKNFGHFEFFECKPEDVPEFSKVNLFYANNGSGKTTLANLFFILSKHCKNKSELVKEYVLPETECEIITESNRYNEKNINTANIDLYVFSTKFINDHVFDGSTVNFDSFSSDIKLTNEFIDKIDVSIEILNRRKDKVETWQGNLESLLDKSWEKYHAIFHDKIKGPRLSKKPSIVSEDSNSNCHELSKEIDSLFGAYGKKNRESQIQQNLTAISDKSNLLESIEIDFYQLNQKLNVEVDELARQKMQNRFTLLKEKIQESNDSTEKINLDDWLNTGTDLLEIKKKHDSRCPLCNSDLSETIDSILKDYSNYFSKEIVNLHTALDGYIQTIDQSLKTLKENKSEIDDLKQLIKANSLMINIESFQDADEVKTNLIKIKEVLTTKKNYPNRKQIITSEIIKAIEKYNDHHTQVKKLVDDTVAGLLESLGSKTQQQIVDDIKRKVNEIVIAEYNQPQSVILNNSKRKNCEIGTSLEKLSISIERRIRKLNYQRSIEISKLDAESKYVNLYLELLGINKFSIRREKGKDVNNIVISYPNAQTEKRTLKFSLSESEKTALALAYFISKVRVEKIEGQKSGLDNCIVVIDDPVSSFDENRLFQTANLIVSFFFYQDAKPIHPNQFFLLSHNIIFLKFFHNALISNQEIKAQTNEYYISPYQSRIMKIPNGLRNFTNTYLIKLNDIIVFSERIGLEYEDARKYLPNYIRIVLESFLSFKFAVVKDDNDRVPGLAHLINKSISELRNFDDYEMDGINRDGIIKRLNHLRQIADHESHGNISRIESVSFISETELRNFCRYTIQVIKYFDLVHFNRVKSLL